MCLSEMLLGVFLRYSRILVRKYTNVSMLCAICYKIFIEMVQIQVLFGNNIICLRKGSLHNMFSK